MRYNLRFFVAALMAIAAISVGPSYTYFVDMPGLCVAIVAMYILMVLCLMRQTHLYSKELRNAG